MIIMARKPILFMGLAGTAMSSPTFGFATKFWMTLGSRLVGSLLNGNVAVMQRMIAEMIRDQNTNVILRVCIPLNIHC
jgi:predicted MFS family arabinose efflux permease